MKVLTIREVARQLCDGLDMDIDDVASKLRRYLVSNPITLKELNERCWNDSTSIFDSIM